MRRSGSNGLTARICKEEAVMAGNSFQQSPLGMPKAGLQNDLA